MNNAYQDQDRAVAETASAMLSRAEQIYRRSPGAGAPEMVLALDEAIDLVATEDAAAYLEAAALLLALARHLVDGATEGKQR